MCDSGGVCCRFQAAQEAIEDRDSKTAAVMAELEVDLELLGATAIEDKLQDGVPETIAMMLEAGIKVAPRPPTLRGTRMLSQL